MAKDPRSGEIEIMPADPSDAAPQGGSTRYAAGEDPAKRERILDGAHRVFMRLGFHASSVNDITREAGVSKGTIYVYFTGKEDLFGALIEREKTKFTQSLRGILAETNDVEDGLERFARAFVRQITESDMIPAMRSVLGVIDRMPILSRRFFSAPGNAKTVLEEFIHRQIGQGNLVVPDPELASRQFIELATGTFFKLRLFNDLTGAPAPQEVDRVILSAIAIFMRIYGPQNAQQH